jgi:hypothetical protein
VERGETSIKQKTDIVSILPSQMKDETNHFHLGGRRTVQLLENEPK